MIKALRLALSLVLFSSVAISQLPSPAQCQMSFGGVFATRCQMACCKKKLPMSSCPMVKATIPRDMISLATPVLDALQPALQSAYTIVLQPIYASITLFFDMTAALQRMSGPPPAARAPPAYIHSINA